MLKTAVRPMAADKIRLLCLHGYTQNASSFSSRMGSYRKGLKSRVEFIFVDAPFESTGLPGLDVKEAGGEEELGRSWWSWTDSGPDARPSRAATYTGCEATLELLVAAIKEHKPNGILGFSQGATAGAMLLAHLKQPEVQAQLEGVAALPSFSILVAGFLPRDPTFAAAIKQARVDVPTLFVHGVEDQLVSRERTEELVQCFSPDAVQWYQHPGAHLVPTCSSAFKQLLVDFIDKHCPRDRASAGSISASATSLSSLDASQS